MDINDYKNIIKGVKEHKLTLDKEQLWLDLQEAQESPVASKPKSNRKYYFLSLALLISFSTCWHLSPDQSTKTANHQTTELVSKSKTPIEQNQDLANIVSNQKSPQKSTTNQAQSKTEKELIKKKTSQSQTSNILVKSTAIAKHNQLSRPESYQATRSSNENFTASKTTSNTARENPSISKTKDAVISIENKSKILQILKLPWIKTIFPLAIRNVFFSDSALAKAQKQTKKEHLKHSLSVMSSVGSISKQLEAKRRQLDGYAAIRNRTERPLEEWSLGLQYCYRFTPKLKANIGLEFSQFTENLSFREMTGVDSSLLFDDEIKKIILFADGSTFEEFGTVNGTAYTFIDYNIYNHYRSLNVPLSVAYTYPINRWSFGASLGASINLWYGFNGSLINEQLSLTENPDYFKTSIGIQYMSGLAIGYALNERASITLGPSLLFGGKSITKDSYSLSQQHKSYRINMGYQYSF